MCELLCTVIITVKKGNSNKYSIYNARLARAPLEIW